MDKLAIWSENYRLRTSDFDCHDNITPTAILDIAQDIAGIHADKLNLGFEDLYQKKLIWVLLRNRFEIINYPKPGNVIKATTWPNKKGRVDFDRNTILYNEDNSILAKIQSKWVIVNYETRRIIPPRNIDFPLEEYNQEQTFNEEFKKIEDFDVTHLIPYTITAQKSDLDHNGHVNNIKYFQMILNNLNDEQKNKIQYGEINYIHEMHYKDIVNLYIKNEDNQILAKAINNNGEIVFIAKLIYFN